MKNLSMFKHEFHSTISDSKIFEYFSRFCMEMEIKKNPDSFFTIFFQEIKNAKIIGSLTFENEVIGLQFESYDKILLNDKGLDIVKEMNLEHFAFSLELPQPQKDKSKDFIFGDIMIDGSPCWDDDNPKNKNFKELISNYTGDDMLKDFVSKDYATLPLKFIDSNVFKALEKINIDSSLFEKSTYECPFSKGNKYYSCLPLMAFVNKESTNKIFDLVGRKIGFFERDMSTEKNIDCSFYRGVTHPDILTSTPQHKFLFGHGYTECTLPSDGNSSSQLILFKYENIFILAEAHFWFNK